MIWQRPEVEQSGPVVAEDRAQYPDTVNHDDWSAEEEDNKRNGQLSSRMLFNLIRGEPANLVLI